MKKIGFIANTARDADLTLTRELMKFAGEMGCEAVTDDLRGSDFIVVLGGDGTMLNAAVQHTEQPLLGINLGTLGYLTDADGSGAKISLEKAIRGDCKLEKRMMVEAVIIKNGEEVSTYTALNEACVKSAEPPKLAVLRLIISGEYIDTYRGDGLLVCTPTGSTAYNLSAGGPILKPGSGAGMMAVTPVCPHTMYARPIVISPDDTVVIRREGRAGAGLVLSADGQGAWRIDDDDEVLIRRSERSAHIIRTTGAGFYDILRKKMIGRGGSVE